MLRLKRYLITGFIVLIPAVMTVYVLVVLFNFVDNILGKYVNRYLEHALGFSIPGLGFLLFFIVIILAGFMANLFIVKKLMVRIEHGFAGLPFVDKIYPAFKQVIVAIFQPKHIGFKQVVLVEYPSKGLWSLGFLTSEQFNKINRLMNRDMVAVFLPHTPSPVTGLIVYVAKEEVKFIDISVSDAIKIVVSGGIYTPPQ